MASFSTNFENLENKLLNIPTDLVSYMRNNNIANSVVLLVLLYVILAAPMLNSTLLSVFNNMFFKVLYVFLIMCLVSRNPVLSLIVAIILVLVLNSLIPDKPKEATKPENKALVIEAGSVIATTASGQTVVLPPNVVPDTVRNDVHPKSEAERVEKFDDTKPVDTIPFDTKPMEMTKSVDTKPVDTIPVDTKPMEMTKPVDTIPVNVNERLTQRQQMKKLWTSINNKPNVLAETSSNKCESASVNSSCDVLGTNSVEFSHARIGGDNEVCPDDKETVGLYENVDKEYADY